MCQFFNFLLHRENPEEKQRATENKRTYFTKLCHQVRVAIYMTFVWFYSYYYSYLALNKPNNKLSVSNYISEKYLFVVALNVGYLKRFSGL